jgi:serine/threonine-protein kinase
MGEEMAINVIGYMATALQAAHAQNVIHRDLKPSNVLVTYEGWVKIADLGLAKETGHQNDLTRADTLVGTPSYMAPENFIAGSEVGPAADIYSLGIMLYEMITGRPPYAGSLNRAISGHLHGEPEYTATVSGKEAPMPPGLVALLKTLLAKKPADRPRDCAKVVELCQARLAELKGGSPQVAADRGVGGRPEDSESSTFRKISQFMEKNLGGTASEYQGKSVVHTSGRERIVIWILLALFVLIFIAAYFVQS